MLTAIDFWCSPTRYVFPDLNTITMQLRRWLVLCCLLGGAMMFLRYQSDSIRQEIEKAQPPRVNVVRADTVHPTPTEPPPTQAQTPAPTAPPESQAQSTQSTLQPPPPPTTPRATPRADTMADWFELWTGEKLSKDTIPIKATATIPNRLFMTWKSKDLPTEPMTARQYWDNWGNQEPQLDRVILDDAECAMLASYYPGLKPRYDGLPLNVMRADLCRVLAIYYFGGYYKDLDVDWRRPLNVWIRPTDDVVYGWEDDEHLCQWFFAAKPGDKCVHSILQHITNIIANTSLIDFKKNIEAVIDITGPGVWTDAMQGCPTPPKYNVQEMMFTNVYHDYASQRWGGKGYKPWIESRKEVAGFEHVWPAYHIAPYFLSPANEHLMAPHPDYPIVEIENVKQSSVRYGIASLSGPQNAFDAFLDTNVETNQEDRPWFEFTFTTALNVGTVVTPDANHLTCMRVYNRHREPGTSDFSEGLHMELFNEEGKLFHKLSKEKRMATFFLFTLAGMPNRVKRVRFYRTPDKKREDPGRPRLTFAEIQLYSDHLCLQARRLSVATVEATSEPNVPPILVLATTLNHYCPDGRALSPFMGFQYSFCGTAPVNCSAFSLTAHEKTEIDSAFVTKMQEIGCPLTTIGPAPPTLSRNVPQLPVLERHINSSWCASNTMWSRCDVFEEMVKATGLQDASFVYLDVSVEDWVSSNSLLSLLDRFGAETALIPMRLNEKTVVSTTIVENFNKIMKRYYLYAAHVNPGEGELRVNGATVPKELHLSFRKR
jgi:mannosyltransferase OCH1-like enzyme